jgi:hypothetical protein
MNVDNYVGKNKKYNKKYLCDKIASHYIRIFNIICAILSAINPEKNMCSRRIKALYDAFFKLLMANLYNLLYLLCLNSDL